MKIVFQDIDGVLNSHSWDYRSRNFAKPKGRLLTKEEQARRDLDPVAIARLNLLLERSGAKVVISSTWRTHFTVEAIRNFLIEKGFTGEILGRTPDESEHNEERYLGHPRVKKLSYWEPYPRGLEIQQWLDEHENLSIESFVILDDEPDMAHLMDRLVRTSMRHGLKDEHVEHALVLLGV